MVLLKLYATAVRDIGRYTYFTNLPAAQRTFITTEHYKRTRKYEYAFGRIDANPISKLRLTSTFLWNPVIDDGTIPTTSFTNVASSGFGFNNVPTANYGGIGVPAGIILQIDKAGVRAQTWLR